MIYEIKNQDQLDEILKIATEKDRIYINTEEMVYIKDSISIISLVFEVRARVQGCCNVICESGSYVESYDSIVHASGYKTKVAAYGNSIVYLGHMAEVKANDRSVVISKGSNNAMVYAKDNATVFALDASIVYASGNSKIFAFDRANIWSYEQSTVSKYGERVISTKHQQLEDMIEARW